MTDRQSARSAAWPTRPPIRHRSGSGRLPAIDRFAPGLVTVFGIPHGLEPDPHPLRQLADLFRRRACRECRPRGWHTRCRQRRVWFCGFYPGNHGTAATFDGGRSTVASGWRMGGLQLGLGQRDWPSLRPTRSASFCNFCVVPIMEPETIQAADVKHFTDSSLISDGRRPDPPASNRRDLPPPS